MLTRRSLVVSLLWLAVAGAGRATEAPLAVSPGDASGLAVVEDRCPTFSWGAVERARSYELVVYLLGDEGEEAVPVLDQKIAGSALGWTPSLDRCLQRGRRYAWSVRAGGRREDSKWSPPSLFAVARAPNAAQLEQALRVVEDYLSETGSTRLPDDLDDDTTVTPIESTRNARVDGSTQSQPQVAGSAGSLPAYPFSMQADQAVAYLESNLNVYGSVIELRNTTNPVFFMGAINFNDATNTFPGQIAYQGDDVMTFRTNGVEQVRIDAAGDVTSKPTANGLVKAWARILSDGTVDDCYKCNERDAAANHTGPGVYQIDFTPSGVNVINRPVLCTVRASSDQNATIACHGALGFVDVEVLRNGSPEAAGFNVVVF